MLIYATFTNVKLGILLYNRDNRKPEEIFMRSILEFLTPKKVTYYINERFTIRQALEKFDAHKFSTVPIIDEMGKYVGTLSEGDILRYIKNVNHFSLENAESTRISELTRYRSYVSIKVDAAIEEVFALGLSQNFVPVVDDSDTYIGIIKRSDIIKYLFEEYERQK